MATENVGSGFRSWGVEGHAIQIEYAVPALEEVCANAVDGLFRFRHGGMEVGGVLFGTAAGDRVRILTYRPLECEHAFGPRFVLSERDRMALKDLLYAPRREPELRGLEPVGWYHSHTRSGVELSPRDIEIYDSYFPQRWQVALVIRPDNYGPARAGFFFRERSGAVHREYSYEEFTSLARRHGLLPEPSVEAEPAEEPAEPSPPEPQPAEAAEPPEPQPRAELTPPEPASAAPPAVPPVDAEVEPLEIPSFARAQPWHGKKWVWALLAVALVSAAAFGAARYYLESAPQASLALWVADVGGQLLIEWDRGAKPLREAHSATLEIQDGNRRVTKTLDRDMLREGSIDYQRVTDVVDVRLRIKRRDRDVEELIRFIGQPVDRGHTAEDLAAARQRDELKAEIDALQVQLAAKDEQIHRLRSRLAADR
jgi:proteasome lid subunit RPN8/RPN11